MWLFRNNEGVSDEGSRLPGICVNLSQFASTVGVALVASPELREMFMGIYVLIAVPVNFLKSIALLSAISIDGAFGRTEDLQKWFMQTLGGTILPFLANFKPPPFVAAVLSALWEKLVGCVEDNIILVVRAACKSCAHRLGMDKYLPDLDDGEGTEGEGEGTEAEQGNRGKGKKGTGGATFCEKCAACSWCCCSDQNPVFGHKKAKDTDASANDFTAGGESTHNLMTDNIVKAEPVSIDLMSPTASYGR